MLGIKNYYWICIVVDRLEKRFLHAITGTRGVVTGKQRWRAIEGPLIDQVMTDYWEPYEHFVPSEQHIQSKAETFTVEGCNGLFRNFLARLRRKIKCDSKSETMLWYSVLLLMAKWHGEREDLLR